MGSRRQSVSTPLSSVPASDQEDVASTKAKGVPPGAEELQLAPKPFRQRGSTMPAITYYSGRWRKHGIGHSVDQTPAGTRLEHESEFDVTEYYRVRSYSVTGRVVTKCGESLRLKFQQHQSTCSVASSCTSSGGQSSSSSSTFRLRSWSHGSTSSELSASGTSTEGTSVSVHHVAVLGAGDVGKRSLIAQFVSFEWDASSLHVDENKMNDEEHNQPAVSVLLDGDESEMHFTKLDSTGDILPEEFVYQHDVDAYIIVYSISDRASFKTALRLLTLLRAAELLSEKGVILVGNKIDLERSRAVSTEEGREAATIYGCKFIETSEWMNHKVDELLVGVLSQIRLKQRQRTQVARSDSRRDRSRNSLLLNGGSRTSERKLLGKRRSRSVVRDLLRKFSISSKSCDNLHVL